MAGHMPATVEHGASPEYRALLEKLPKDVQDEARRRYHLMKNDPNDPDVKLKRLTRVKGKQMYSARSGPNTEPHYRSLGVGLPGITPLKIKWFWIGTHDDYVRIINK